ncbi:hypothetical protein [Hymenobacter sp. APR13]|uniref:hypothetical protein n=1 Tax=Hymenobacter sp. APR13 TaxID=1356852 RepID=UPI0004E09BB7|nr:hypothetical protein [Hymenobacter sp. APR13]AII50386.1 hypothetical protein N008_00100 [Hymenobacter sp. APR13]
MTDEEWLPDNERIKRILASFDDDGVVDWLTLVDFGDARYLVGTREDREVNTLQLTIPALELLRPHFSGDAYRNGRSITYFTSLFRRWKIEKLLG